MISRKISALLRENVAVTHCHMCKGKRLRLVLNLGHQPHSDDFLAPERLNEAEMLYPLRLVQCEACGLLQIDYRVSPAILYGLNYAYQSSANVSGVQHYLAAAEYIAKKSGAEKGSFAIDIGSNVGVLLEGFKRIGCRVLGVEPAGDIARIARTRGIRTISKFFSATEAKKIAAAYGQADIITTTNVFAHLHDIHDAARGIKTLLKKSGTFVVEAPSALDLVKNLEYDTIYHQHIAYLSVRPMRIFFKRNGLELYDVEHLDIHGGSLRYFIGWPGHHMVAKSVAKEIKIEERFGLYDRKRLAKFASDVAQQKKALQQMLLRLVKKGRKIAAVSAPAKGNTLLNYCHIDTSLLSYATEKNTMKIGTYTPGMHIPVVGDEMLWKNPPDYALLLAWNFAESIMERHADFRKKGGKFIVPIPKPTIV